MAHLRSVHGVDDGEHLKKERSSSRLHEQGLLYEVIAPFEAVQGDFAPPQGQRKP